MSEHTTLQEAVDKALHTLQELMEGNGYSGDEIKLQSTQAVLVYAAERKKDGDNE